MRLSRQPLKQPPGGTGGSWQSAGGDPILLLIFAELILAAYPLLLHR